MLHPVVDIIGVSFIGMKLLHLSGATLNAWISMCFAAAFLLARLSLHYFETPMRIRLSPASDMQIGPATSPRGAIVKDPTG